jgi:hypothetical protein
MGGAARQEFIWIHVLTELAMHYGVQGQVTMGRECLDPKIQWSYSRNVWKNAGVRSTMYPGCSNALGCPAFRRR